MYRGMSLTKSLTQNFSIFLSKTNPNRKERKRRSTFFSSSLNFFSSFILTIFVFANANSNAVVYQWMKCGGAGRSVFVYCENYYSHICIEWSRIMKASINTDRESEWEREIEESAKANHPVCIPFYVWRAFFAFHHTIAIHDGTHWKHYYLPNENWIACFVSAVKERFKCPKWSTEQKYI